MGWPKKMWGRKPTPKLKPEKPDFKDMSLFTDAVRKLEEKEAELAAAHERIRNLEIALKAARVDKLRAMEGRWKTRAVSEVPGKKVSQNHNEINSLSDDDVEALFKMREEAKVDDQVEAYRQPDEDEKPVKRGFLSPLLRVCALVSRK